jgi:small subunit ribosomal protein S1
MSKKDLKELDLKLEDGEEKVLFEDLDENFEKVSEKKPENEMEELLKDNLPVIPEEGTKIKGRVLEIDTHSLFVDLGEMGVGIIYGKEVKDGFGSNRKKLKPGDEITASVIDQENEEGYVELSVREAIREEAWKDLSKKKDTGEIISVKILDANKGGLMVEVNNITGFMPVSQLTAEHYPRVEDGDKNKIFEILKSYVNNDMRVCVIDAILDEEKLIVSEKEAYKEEEKKNIAEFKVGDVVEGEVSGVVDFGAFVKFFPPSRSDSKDDADKLEGLVHISQLDWKLIDNPRDVVSIGDRVKAKIISIDDTRISLSVRELKADPWTQVGEKYKVGEIVEGVVNKLNHFGAFVYLNEDIHGLSHISEFISRYPGKNVDEVIQTGETYLWQIMSMDPNKHRMGLKFVGELKDKEKLMKAKSASAKSAISINAQADKVGEMKDVKKSVDKKVKVEKSEVKK